MNRRLGCSAFLGLLLAVASPTAPPAHAAADPSPLDTARRLNLAFIEVADTVSEAVVVVQVVQQPDANPDDSMLEMLPPELRKHYEEYREKQDREGTRPNRRPANPEPVTGNGSGIILTEEGYILTNNHVIEDAERITIRTKDGREFPAVVRGRDAKSDLAVLKIEAKGLKPARLGDSTKTRVGEFAIAIGAPFHLDYTVTFGHVSAKGRSGIIPVYAGGGSMDQDYIQTDADINPGNSGGPLVNLDGEVIGINTLIRGLNLGLGFAIPINLAREIADQLIKEGRFVRAWLGVGIRDLREHEDFKRMFPDLRDGVVVESIQPDGPASRSELRPADVILAVNGKPVASTQALRNEIRGQAGNKVTLEIARNGAKRQMQIEPEPWREEGTKSTRERKPREAKPIPPIGLKVQTLKGNKDLARRYDTHLDNGVVVTEVTPGSAAAAKGIRPGYVITEVNFKKVNSREEFLENARESDLAKGILIHFNDQNAPRFEVLTSGRD